MNKKAAWEICLGLLLVIFALQILPVLASLKPRSYYSYYGLEGVGHWLVWLQFILIVLGGLLEILGMVTAIKGNSWVLAGTGFLLAIFVAFVVARTNFSTLIKPCGVPGIDTRPECDVIVM